MHDKSPQLIKPVAIKSLDLRLKSGSWAFAEAEKQRIGAHWRKLADGNPRIWNGDVLICSGAAITGEALTGQFIKTDYASFVAWRDWGWPDKDVCNVFGSAAVLSADGAVLYGRMASHTLNAGKVYPPGGSLEMKDVGADGEVDIMGSITRELEEETGLKAEEAERGELLAIFDGPRLSVAQVFHFASDAAALAQRVRSYLPGAHEDELSDIEVIRSSSQIDSAIPPYAVALARYLIKPP
ncbi:NUDIX hydrolase [Taklimakanibacter lacteus]|uniref:NUDIX hydrolase n=1 Tax=Taklimakanibacter lacteus TaxID=2268456 RepID=UPI000E660AD0